MVLKQEMKEGGAFPYPYQGALVEKNPPSFNWLREKAVISYFLIIEKKENNIWKKYKTFQTEKNIAIFRELFTPGEYRWNIFSQDKKSSRGWYDFTLSEKAHEYIIPTPEEVLKQIPETHPRHCYYSEDLEYIRDHYKEEKKVLRRNIKEALKRSLPPRPVFHKPQGEPVYRLAFGEYRSYVDRDLVACSLGYLLFEDKAAGSKARDSFMEIIDWNPQGPCSVIGPWGDEIGLSNSRTLFSVYDWLFDLFTEKEHDYIRRTLTQYALLIEERLLELDFLTNPGHSHAGRIPAYLGEAAMVLYGYIDKRLSLRWLSYSMEVFGSLFPHFGGNQGGWAEGPFYASSYTKWYLPFFFAIERHTGFSFLNQPFYQRLSQYFIHFSPPNRDSRPFGDGYWCQPDDKEWPGFCAQNPFGVYAERFGPDLARRFSQELSQPDIFKLHLLDIFRVPSQSSKGDEAGPISQSRLFPEVGLATMHTNVENPHSDRALLFRASPFGAISHEHADQGNFALIVGNKTILGPSGYFGFAFGTDHHKEWTRQTKAHNCLLINGKGQTGPAHKITGKIVSLTDEDSLHGKDGSKAEIKMDLTEAYNKEDLPVKEYLREITFYRPHKIIIRDKLVLTRKADKIDVRFHSNFKPVFSNGEKRTEIITGGKQYNITVLCNNKTITYSQENQFPIPVNKNIPIQQHVYPPEQFHMNWELESFKEGEIVSEIEILDL